MNCLENMMKNYSDRSHVVTGFVPDFQKNHLPFGNHKERSTGFHDAGSYCKAKQKKARHSQQPQLLQDREAMAGKVKREKKETIAMQVVVL